MSQMPEAITSAVLRQLPALLQGQDARPIRTLRGFCHRRDTVAQILGLRDTV